MPIANVFNMAGEKIGDGPMSFEKNYKKVN